MTHETSFELRQALFHALDANDSSGMPVCLSGKQLLEHAPFQIRFDKLRRSLMTGPGSLPVAMLAAHSDVAKQGRAAHTFFTRLEPDKPTAAQRLLAHEHVVRGDHERSPVPDTAAALEFMRSNAGSASDRCRGALAALFSTRRAAATLHVTQAAVTASSAAATEAAAAAKRLFRSYVEAECLRGGFSVDNAPAHVKRTALAALLRSKTHGRKETDPALLYTDEDLYSVMKREGLEYVLERFTREAPGKWVRVNCEWVGLLVLDAEPETIWRRYWTDIGDLRRSCFLTHCFLPQMRLCVEEACLCGLCLRGKEACKRLFAHLCDLREFESDAALEACKERAAAWEHAFLQFQSDVYGRIKEDPLDDNFRGRLTLDELLGIEVPALDGLLDACLALVVDPVAQAEWIADARGFVSGIDKYQRHLLGKCVQNARARQIEKNLPDLRYQGKLMLYITIDYKEKLPYERKQQTPQSDYWDNASLSLLGCAIVWCDSGGDLRTHNFDMLSTDTTQDAVWTENGIRRLGEFLLERQADGFFGDLPIAGIIGDSDNGCHFRNSSMFASILPSLAVALGIKYLAWHLSEPGEGKRACDRHFGSTGVACKTFLCTPGAQIVGIPGYLTILNAMSNTTAVSIDICRDASVQQRFDFAGLSANREYVLRAGAVLAPTAALSDAAFCQQLWEVSPYSGIGPATPLTAGAMHTVALRFAAADGYALLRDAFKRRADGTTLGKQLADLLPLLLHPTHGVITDADNFKDESKRYDAVQALKKFITGEYTAAEQQASGYSGLQRTPHGLVAAILQLEHRRQGEELKALQAAVDAGSAAPGAPQLALAAPPPPPPAGSAAAAPAEAAPPAEPTVLGTLIDPASDASAAVQHAKATLDMCKQALEEARQALTSRGVYWQRAKEVYFTLLAKEGAQKAAAGAVALGKRRTR